MIYYNYMTNAKNTKLSLLTVQPQIIDFFDASKVELQEPVEIKTYNHRETDKEEDYIGAGNPCFVSEEFKNLVEELDPNAAQFFETKNIDCTTQKKYYLMHVTQVVYCLSREHSKIMPGLFPGQVEDIVIPFVDSTKIPPNVHMFRLGEDSAEHYVSHEFYKQYRKRKLTGCSFYKWTAPIKEEQ